MTMATYAGFAIITKYIGPTDFRGSRVKAYCGGWTHTVAYDAGMTALENHSQAALALRLKRNLTGEWIAGEMPDGTGYAFLRVVER